VAAHRPKNGSAASRGDAEASTELDCPEPAHVRAQLERILDSDEFIGSDRTHRFLRFVVEETLAGRGDRIKAFSVAIAAFDRDEAFDPQTDPIVRIEAGRLRRSLERYYFVAGAKDPVRIEIPKGTYVPEFSWLDAQDPDGSVAGSTSAPTVAASAPRSLGQLPRFPWPTLGLMALIAVISGLAVFIFASGTSDQRAAVDVKPNLPHPSVAILPLGVSGGGQLVTRLSSGMTNEVIRELSRYSSVFVLGPQSIQRFGPTPDVTVMGADTGLDFVLSGSIQHAGDRIQVSVQLSDTVTGGIFWAETYDRDFAVERVFDLQVEIARDIVRRIGQPQGAIARFDWKRTRGKAPEAWEAYDCVLQADDLRRRVLPPALAPEVRACLERAVHEEPGYADAWMMLALIEIDEARFTPLALAPPDRLDLAHSAARRAVELAPDSGKAHMALMMASFLRGEVEEALASGQVAMQLDPHDPDILAEVGLRHVIAGDLESGMDLIERALHQYETVPLSYRMGLALGYLRQGLYQKASDAAGDFAQTPNFVYWSMVAAIHGKAGRHDKAREAARKLLELYPDFPRWAWSELERRSLAPELATRMVEGWKAAGLDIPPPPPGGAIP
jgi:TolB-like protein